MKKLMTLNLIIINFFCVFFGTTITVAQSSMRNFLTESEKKEFQTQLQSVETSIGKEIAEEAAPEKIQEKNYLKNRCEQLIKNDNNFKETLSKEEASQIPTTEEVFFLFSHGLWGSEKQATWYVPLEKSEKDDWYLITCPYFSFNFPDVKIKNGKILKGEVDKKYVNLGQTLDIKKFIEEYKKLPKNKKVVLIGQSRGAITIINALATYPQEFKNVKAVILESPADDPLNVIKNYYTILKWTPDFMLKRILSWYYPLYDTNAPKPIDLVEKTDKNIPILIIHSNQDEMTPMENVKSLVEKFQKTGHNKVSFLTLEKGLHGKYNCPQKPKENKECLNDAKIYRGAVHLFYKMNGIPYEQKFIDDETFKKYLNSIKK